MIAQLAADTGVASGSEWVPLAVAIIAAVSAIGAAYWNTRGETSALRRLKAMNDVLKDLPPGAESTRTFTVARDRLAQRVANRISGPSFWRRVRWWVLGVIVGAGVVVGLVWLSTHVGTENAPAIPLFAFLTTVLGASVSTLIASISDYTARARKRQSSKYSRTHLNSARKAHNAPPKG